MTDKRLKEEYKKIKPQEGLKARIACELVFAQEQKRKPFYLRMKPMLSGALACVLLVACITVIPFDPLGGGEVFVSYAQNGEAVQGASTGRAYAISELDNVYYEYKQLDDQTCGAEFTFNFEGNTEVTANSGNLYKKEEDGSYTMLSEKSRIEGAATLLWAIDDGETGEGIIFLKNRTGKWELRLSCVEEGYAATFWRTE